MTRTLLIYTLGLAANLFAQPGKPNIVFMIADDCTYRDIGCYGGQAYTPNIDKLAEEGMRFTRCFQTAPMCSPTRHSIYTGQYPVKSGAYPNHTQVNPGVKSIVQYLSDLGYRVAQSGKSHVGPAKVFRWETIPGTLDDGFGKVDEFLADAKKGDKPFCLLLCSHQPHSPWDKGDPSKYPPGKIKLPPYLVDTPETRDGMSRYLAEITFFDGQVGDALALLDKHGLRGNTLFVMTSEQGNSLPFAKFTCYDSGLQSAFVARWPGKIEAGSVNPAMIEYVDILPTFIEAAGGKPDPVIDGKSLLPLFAGKQDHKKYVYGEMTTRGVMKGSDHFGIRSVRSDRFKYVWNFTPDAEFKNEVTSSEIFKSWEAKASEGDKEARELVNKYKSRPKIELYDVVGDPLEMNNIAGNPEHAQVMAELRAELDRWMAHCGDEGQKTELEALDHMRDKAANRFNKSGKRKNK